MLSQGKPPRSTLHDPPELTALSLEIPSTRFEIVGPERHVLGLKPSLALWLGIGRVETGLGLSHDEISPRTST